MKDEKRLFKRKQSMRGRCNEPSDWREGWSSDEIIKEAAYRLNLWRDWDVAWMETDFLEVHKEFTGIQFMTEGRRRVRALASKTWMGNHEMGTHTSHVLSLEKTA